MRIILFCLALFGAGLSAPSTSAQNLYHDGANHNVACSGPQGVGGIRALYEILSDQVTNSQQLYGVSSFWNDNHGRDRGDNSFCDVIDLARFASMITNRAQACRAGVWGCERVGFIGWIITDRWLVPVDVVAFPAQANPNGFDYGDTLMVRPAKLYDRRQLTLHRACLRRHSTINLLGVTIYGHQLNDYNRFLCQATPGQLTDDRLQGGGGAYPPPCPEGDRACALRRMQDRINNR